jgi:CheY-specific phosphatase CheX
MTSPAAGLGGWLADLEGAFQDISASALGFPAMTVVARHAAAPSEQAALLGLMGPAGAVQIGLAASAAGCQALAKGLMGLGPAEEALPDSEMADALCEIVNIAAGAFKARLRDRASPLQMGLPVFIHGSVKPTDHVAVRVAEVRFGEVVAALLLVHPRTGHEA